MFEIIRFAWGTCSLGDFVLVISDKGIVALEFSSTHTATIDALRKRFAGATLERRQEEMAGLLEVVIAVIENPARACDLPLDLRGTPYEVQVWQMLREVPVGQTISYGALAARLGSSDARDVTAAIANNSIAVIIPCHRVIRKDGSISGYRWGVNRKRRLLAREQPVLEH
ncbi:AraC family transcriptional regulator of adaptative response/methylated-DNA-[protein]-cysteine methyltransferase [Ochrobactrum sp. 19YEA23]|uniref:methylated-DNA--[protein]-cysteine S-methyltransferase n=1 Tax=Ochrobactrum sp. 19YEA23 TaxID=3039854 RepID=UPI00247A1B37|nr:AraC family transcriptional regulator of adaptative response/methylated-DNA-[protein]-cysteine methyltransferase [Ochrobactrum sp. 19YEA23]